MRALVTGASRGIGRATALRLAHDGADLAVHFQSHGSEAQAVVDEVLRLGREAFTLQGDLSDLTSIPALADEIESRWDTVDVLVHNGGTYPRKSFTETADSDFEEQLRMHVVGPASLTRQLLPLLKRSASGRIIFVSSRLAYDGSRHGSPYATAKAAQIGLARSLALELRRESRSTSWRRDPSTPPSSAGILPSNGTSGRARFHFDELERRTRWRPSSRFWLRRARATSPARPSR